MACCATSNSHDTAPLRWKALPIWCIKNGDEVDVDSNFDVIRTIHDNDDDDENVKECVKYPQVSRRPSNKNFVPLGFVGYAMLLTPMPRQEYLSQVATGQGMWLLESAS